jgi:hypothetical protein
VLSTRGHNTVRVDGLDQHRRGLRETYILEFPFEPLGNPWVSGEHFDFAQGVYDIGYGDENQVRVRHERSVLFVKPQYWLVVDRMVPEDTAEHSYESLFHLDAEEATVAEDLSTTSVTGEGQSRLRILPMLSPGLRAEVVKGVEEEPVQGWSYAMVGRKGAIPTAVYSLSGAGEQTMVYVLEPIAADGESALLSVEPLASAEGVVAGQITLRDGSRHIFALQSESREVSFGSFATDAQAAFVEVPADGGTGRSFLFGGEELRPAQ